MTYLSFLIYFVIFPSLLLMVLLRHQLDRRWWAATGVLALIAVIWTTPWDNYLVANNVWWYDEDKVLGIILGYVPLEEYGFFVLQTALTSLWIKALLTRFPTTSYSLYPVSRLMGLLILLPVAILMVILLLTGDPRWNYLLLEVGWLALTPVAIQWFWGFDILVRYWRVWLLGVLVPTLWLSAMDAVAIHDGIWTIDPQQTTGIKLWVLPIEEIVFFAITNILITQGMILMLTPESWQRMVQFRAYLQDKRQQLPKA